MNKHLMIAALIVLALPALASAAPILDFGQDREGISTDDSAPWLAEQAFQARFQSVFLQDYEEGSPYDFGNGMTGTPNAGRLLSGSGVTHFGNGYWQINSNTYSVTYVFSRAVNSFGIWLGDVDMRADIFVSYNQTELDVPDHVTSEDTSGELMFLGLYDPEQSFTEFTIRGMAWYVNLDNAQIGGLPAENVPTPEPSTFLLLGAGLASIAVVHRRRKTAAKTD